MNTDKKAIKAAIGARLLARQATLFPNAKGKSKVAGNDEAAFLAGAASALQAVFGDPNKNELTDYVPPLFILYPMTGRSVTEYLKSAEGKAEA